MGQNTSDADAAVKDVLIILSKEECALGMEQRRNNAIRIVVSGGVCRKHAAMQQ